MSHVQVACKRIVTISQTMGEKIDEMRAWANDRAIMADESLETRPAGAILKFKIMVDLT